MRKDWKWCTERTSIAWRRRRRGKEEEEEEGEGEGGREGGGRG